MLTLVGMLVGNGYFLFYLIVLWQYMLLFFSSCWGLLDSPVNAHPLSCCFAHPVSSVSWCVEQLFDRLKYQLCLVTA